MRRHLLILVCLVYSVIANSHDSIQAIIDNHLQQYGEKEHFSAIQASIHVNGTRKTYCAGRTSIHPDSELVTPSSLFNIGSITKSYTATLALMAEKEGKIVLKNPLQDYLNSYPHWGEWPLYKLLNMSTGIPNYSDSPTFNYLVSQNIRRFWSTDRLLDLVYSEKFNPPFKSGYFYSNTGYILMEKVLSAQYNVSFKDLLIEKIIKPLKLMNTFYPIPVYSNAVSHRLVHGYSYNLYDNPELLGQDVTENNLSWAAGAGGLVANSEDVLRWVQALFIDNQLLNKAQLAKMQQLVSTKTGLPMSKPTKSDSRGFGLGIVESYNERMGRFWFYEGETLGYRALYLYVPCNKIIVSALFNSATNSENDRAGQLMQGIYDELLRLHPQLACKRS